jgi:3-oxoacyl-(acyl-carrier-protein) synthase
MSEGAAVLIFETETHLRNRGGRAWAEVLSGTSTSDAFSLVRPDPEPRQAAESVRDALEQAGLNIDEIADETYVSAHGTSTRYNDIMETETLKSVFGRNAYRLQISSIKSMLGHMIGAACAVEMAACCRALHEGVLPPTINYETPDPGCDLNYVPNTAVKKDVRYAVNNSFAFGGHNVSLVLEKVEDDDLRRP